MSLPPPKPSPLVYLQDDSFHTAVGEPLPPGSVARVVIGKWDALYADALRMACERAFAGVAIVVSRCGEELLQALRDRPADVALLGLTFVDLDGVDVLQAIAREHLARRVMIVSGRKDEHSLQALRTSQFDGFFDPFAESVEALVDALRQVAEGHGYLSLSLRRQFAAQRSIGILAPRLSLSELQVFCVIGDGSDDAEAADRLGLSVATVQTHRRNIMRKLDIATSAKLVREAVRLGVVQIKSDGQIVRPGFEQMVASRQARRPFRVETDS
jgi:DNA-binding NarL/FixJ family response regulator